MKTEYRLTSGSELRALAPTDAAASPKLAGYFAMYNKLSEPMGPRGMQFRERIKPGAFRSAFAAGADIRAVYDHNTSAVLGRTTSGTLRLIDDPKGGAFECDPPQTDYATDAIESIKRKDVSEMSFGMRNIKDQWSTENGQRIRDIISADIFEISPTAFPAYPGTTVQLRSLLASMDPELRAEMLINDDSLRCSCRCGLEILRSAFDCTQRIIDRAKAVEAPDADDVQALSDFLDQAEDLAEKLDQLETATTSLFPETAAEAEATRSMNLRRQRLELAARGVFSADELRSMEAAKKPA